MLIARMLCLLLCVKRSVKRSLSRNLLIFRLVISLLPNAASSNGYSESFFDYFLLSKRALYVEITSLGASLMTSGIRSAISAGKTDTQIASSSIGVTLPFDLYAYLLYSFSTSCSNFNCRILIWHNTFGKSSKMLFLSVIAVS